MTMGIQAIISRLLPPRSRGILLFLLVAGVAAYAAGLFVHVTRDASKYAALAREIYATVKLDQPIPEKLFTAVAEVLAVIYRLKHAYSK